MTDADLMTRISTHATKGPTTAMTDEPPVTVIPLGKRAGPKAVLRVAADSPVPVITQTALVSPVRPSLVPPARNDRRTAQERVEAALRAEAVSVALAQPHRAGSDDPRMAFALGRFCASTWSRDRAWADSMHAAGTSYATEVRAVKVARGFHVAGSDRELARKPGDAGDPTPDQIADLRSSIEGLERTLAKADALLHGVMPRCPRAMVRLCCDHEDPSPYDGDMLMAGLYRLALHYGHIAHARK